LNGQQNNGSWFDSSPSKKKNKESSLDIRYDDAGIALFLLNYLPLDSNNDVQTAVTKAIANIIDNKTYMKYLYSQLALKSSYDLGDGGKGILFLLIRAYEVLHNDVYKEIVTNALLKYPPRIIHPNFTQENGLAVIGEVYLEAYRVFKTEEWKSRAEWIANIYIHSFFRNRDGSGHWIMEQNNPPTADFLTGISGIIHFLARCIHPDKIRYRLFDK
jgi:hypothetical protein